MNKTSFFILALLDIIAELVQLTFELGTFTRKYVVLALVAVYVAGEIAWDMITSIEIELPTYKTPITA